MRQLLLEALCSGISAATTASRYARPLAGAQEICRRQARCPSRAPLPVSSRARLRSTAATAARGSVSWTAAPRPRRPRRRRRRARGCVDRRDRRGRHLRDRARDQRRRQLHELRRRQHRRADAQVCPAELPPGQPRLPGDEVALFEQRDQLLARSSRSLSGDWSNSAPTVLTSSAAWNTSSSSGDSSRSLRLRAGAATPIGDDSGGQLLELHAVLVELAHALHQQPLGRLLDLLQHRASRPAARARTCPASRSACGSAPCAGRC